MDGSGTEADPYHIRSTADLELLSGDGYGSYIGSDVHFSLETNLDFDGGSFTPIGTTDYIFNGNFHGNNHVISNMTITSESGFTGFFMILTSTAFVEKLIFKNCTVTDTSSTGYVGMVAGRIYGSTQVTLRNIETDNCTVTASGSYIGGLIGQANRDPVLASGNRTYFYNCYVHDGHVKGSKYVGGIAGYGAYISTKSDLHALTFLSCKAVRMYVRGTTTSTDIFVGGLVGFTGGNNTSISFTGCKVLSCVIITAGYSVGGLTGCGGANCTTTYTGCVVDNSLVRSTGRVAGGLIGLMYNTTVSTITDCSVTRCTVQGTQQIGGLIGRVNEASSGVTYTITNPTITNNCIAGSSSATSVGGVIGYDVAAS